MELVKEFLQFCIQENLFYNTVRKKVMKDTYNAETNYVLDIKNIEGLNEPIELAGYIMGDCFDLFEKYDKDKGSLFNWLLKTIPNRIQWQFKSFISTVEEDENIGEVQIMFDNNHDIITPVDFNRFSFLFRNKQKEIAHMYWNLGLSQKQISKALNIGPGNLSNSLVKIQDILRSHLQQEFYFYFLICIKEFKMERTGREDNNIVCLSDLDLTDRQKTILYCYFQKGMSISSIINEVDTNSRKTLFNDYTSAMDYLKEYYKEDLYDTRRIMNALENHIAGV